MPWVGLETMIGPIEINIHGPETKKNGFTWFSVDFLNSNIYFNNNLIFVIMKTKWLGFLLDYLHPSSREILSKRLIRS
jgi:hypothetical protein